MPDETSEPVISYSIKDILERLERKIDTKFDGLTVALGNKAESAELATVMVTVARDSERLTDVERRLDAQQEKTNWRTDWRRWFTTTALTAALTAVSIFSIIHG